MTESPAQSPNIDPAIPRRMYWSDKLANPSRCPQCGTLLVQDQQSYAVMIEENKRLNSYVLGSDGGYFCPECPTVVLEVENFKELVEVGAGTKTTRFMVIGLVDLDAIPEDKANEPMGTDDNPVPVVEFIRDAPVKTSKIGRNDPCPCGSGKKYKKCCGANT